MKSASLRASHHRRQQYLVRFCGATPRSRATPRCEHGGMRIAQRGANRLRIDRAQSHQQTASALQTDFRDSAAPAASWRSVGSRFGGVAFIEHTLGDIALPAARAIERGGERRIVELFEIRDGAKLCADGRDAVDAPFVGPGAHIQPAERFRGDPLGMFEHEPIEIGDIESAIGAGLEHDGAKPFVGAREKFALLFVIRAMAGE